MSTRVLGAGQADVKPRRRRAIAGLLPRHWRFGALRGQLFSRRVNPGLEKFPVFLTCGGQLPLQLPNAPFISSQAILKRSVKLLEALLQMGDFLLGPFLAGQQVYSLVKEALY